MLYEQFKSLAVLTLAASASAFAPSSLSAHTSTAVFFEHGEYDDGMWDNDSKKDIYAKFDPSKPRSTRNFYPFETFQGNSPDASGIYPGETRYKDPKRGDVSFALMQVERAEIEERLANPKPGFAPGCPGCKN